MTIARRAARRAAGRALLALAVVLTSAGVARAQSAEAETLFREGKHLLKQGHIAEACDKLEASERLEPTAGTELNLADCREKNGQLATAWAMFVKAAATAKHSDSDGKREGEARRRAAELEPRLVHLRLVVPDDHPAGLVIKRNGSAIDAELWNQRIPVDPGNYVISAEAAGYEPWEATVTIKAKDRKVEVPVLDKAAGQSAVATAAPLATPAAQPAVSAHASASAAVAPERPGMTTQRKAGLAVTGVGVGLLAGAFAIAAVANNHEGQSNTLCPSTFCQSANGLELNALARREATYANVGFGVAGAAIVTGAVLWALGGHKPPVEVTIDPHAKAGMLALGASW